MAGEKKFVAGTRGSKLALKQVDIVVQALKAVDPNIEVEVRVIQTTGDTNQNPIPLDTIGKGLFTLEIESQLLDGSIDFAVHSLKDLAGEMPENLVIGAYPAREDARDVLITKDGRPFEKLQEGSIVGTDSTRRQIQMLALRPDVQMKSLRGNVPKRVEKLQTEDYDAIILAAAGLKRLDMLDQATKIFDPREMTPSPGQGTLAVQMRKTDFELSALLAHINDADAARAAMLERAFSQRAGGGCKSPSGAYAWRVGDVWYMIGMLAHQDGKSVERMELSAPHRDSLGLGTVLAERLLEKIYT
jgi:hydroxymethylbilane synthase